MPSLTELWEFLVAVGSNWVGLMSGLVGLIFEIIAYVKRRKQSFWAFSVVGGICILIAAFIAWMSEHRLLSNEHQLLTAELEKNLPKLSCEIDQVSHGHNETGSLVVMIATVRNIGAPSIAEDYFMKVLLMDGSEITGRTLTIPPQLSFQTPNGQARVIQGSRALYNKTVEPIGKNSIRRGYLLFSFKGVPEDRLSASTKEFLLSLRDVYKNQILCSRSPDQSGPDISVDYPGTE